MVHLAHLIGRLINEIGSFDYKEMEGKGKTLL